MTQYLYLISCDKYFKVGIANDVESRLAQLQTGSPYELQIEECYEFENSEIVEKAIHQAWKQSRVRGEWFDRGADKEACISEFHRICTALGGFVYRPESYEVSDEDVEYAERESEYSPTIDDIKRIIDGGNYRVEKRYNQNGLRGFAWRLRSGNKEFPLYIGKKSPIFEQVKAMLAESENK